MTPWLSAFNLLSWVPRVIGLMSACVVHNFPSLARRHLPGLRSYWIAFISLLAFRSVMVACSTVHYCIILYIVCATLRTPAESLLLKKDMNTPMDHTLLFCSVSDFFCAPTDKTPYSSAVADLGGSLILSSTISLDRDSTLLSNAFVLRMS